MNISLKDVYKDYFKIGAAENAEMDGHFTFEDADKIYGFAKANNIPVRGHNFVWHQAMPDWIFKNTDREGLLRRLENHIKVLSEKYPDLYCWDCINEGIDDGDGYLRKTPWLEIVGKGRRNRSAMPFGT